MSAFYKNNSQPIVDDRYMRFHVVANSDSPDDQQLKLRIRDRLLKEFDDTFKDVESIEEAEDKIRAKLYRLEEIANDEISRSGKDYSARAILGSFDFPIKAYGNLVLPAGRYNALKVVLGDGKGANWWCVMFPPLCFVDISHGVAVDVEDDDLDETLEDGCGVEDRENLEEHDKYNVEKSDSLKDRDKLRVGEGRKTILANTHDGRDEKREDVTVIEYRFKSKDWFKDSLPKMVKLFSLIPGL